MQFNIPILDHLHRVRKKFAMFPNPAGEKQPRKSGLSRRGPSATDMKHRGF